MIKWPKGPTGLGKDSGFFNQLLACCKQAEPKVSPNMRIIRQDQNGTVLDSLAGSGGTPSSPFKPYIITTLNNADYFTAQLYNWTTKMASGSNVTIAKAMTGRGPDSQQIDGNLITYSYAPLTKDNLRVAETTGMVSQWHVMNPRYLIDDGSGLIGNVIFACQVVGGTGVKDAGGNPVLFQEFGNRNWAYQWNQSGTLP